MTHAFLVPDPPAATPGTAQPAPPDQGGPVSRVVLHVPDNPPWALQLASPFEPVLRRAGRVMRNPDDKDGRALALFVQAHLPQLANLPALQPAPGPALQVLLAVVTTGRRAWDRQVLVVDLVEPASGRLLSTPAARAALGSLSDLLVPRWPADAPKHATPRGHVLELRTEDTRHVLSRGAPAGAP